MHTHGLKAHAKELTAHTFQGNQAGAKAVKKPCDALANVDAKNLAKSFAPIANPVDAVSL